MKIISDTGPIIGLAKIDRLPILKDIADEILIPPMVYREILGKVGAESERIDRALANFIHKVELNPPPPEIQEVLQDLDEGERQTIALASILSEDVLLLMDDRAGRIAAAKLGIPTTGLIGILLLAKEKGILDNISSLICELRNQGYWISDEITNIARHLANEK